MPRRTAPIGTSQSQRLKHLPHLAVGALRFRNPSGRFSGDLGNRLLIGAFDHQHGWPVHVR